MRILPVPIKKSVLVGVCSKASKTKILHSQCKMSTKHLTHTGTEDLASRTFTNKEFLTFLQSKLAF